MPGVASDGGRGHCTSLGSYHLPQAGQPQPIKVLAIKVFGKRKRKKFDWVEAFWLEMELVITTKWTALLKYKQCPSKQKLEDLRNARNTAQQTARCCASKYLVQLSTENHTCSDTGNIRGMIEGIKKGTGPTQSKTAPLKSPTSKVIT